MSAAERECIWGANNAKLYWVRESLMRPIQAKDERKVTEAQAVMLGASAQLHTIDWCFLNVPQRSEITLEKIVWAKRVLRRACGERV